MLVSLCLVTMSCASFQYPDNGLRLKKGGEAYCEAYRIKDSPLKKEIAKIYGLNAEDWDQYCGDMQMKAYSSARDIAKKKKLGSLAVKKATLAHIWQYLDGGHIFIAYITCKQSGMEEIERRALAETAFSLKMQNGRCREALDLAKIFSLPLKRFESALSCIAKKSGNVSVLSSACAKGIPKESIEHYKKKFLLNILKWYDPEGYQGELTHVINHCDWNKEDLEYLMAFMQSAGNAKLALAILGKLSGHLSKEKVHVIATSLFDEAIKKKEAVHASEVYRSYPKAFHEKQATLLLHVFIENRMCTEALQLTHVRKLDDAQIDAVFTARRCDMSNFERFEWDFNGVPKEVWEKYFGFALKHQRFGFARRLADTAQRFRKDGVDSHAQLVDEAFKVKAHALLLQLSPPPGEDRATYKNRIFEDALSNREEWIAATYAREHHPYPEAIIERAFLRAAERGEFILATQIAETYGASSKVVSRGILAFEMAMIAKKPRDAQFILRLIGLKDSERQNRAALLRFRIKREEDRKLWRKKRKQERKRKRESGEWSVTRD